MHAMYLPAVPRKYVMISVHKWNIQGPFCYVLEVVKEVTLSGQSGDVARPEWACKKSSHCDNRIHACEKQRSMG